MLGFNPLKPPWNRSLAQTDIDEGRPCKGSTLPRRYLIALLAIAFCNDCGPKNSPDAQAKQRLDVLAQAALKGDIQTVEVLHIPSYIESPVPITIGGLNAGWLRRATIKSPVRDRLAKVLGSDSPLRGGAPPTDIRWRFSFYSTSEERIGDLYFDRDCRLGYVDDSPVSFQSGLLNELQRALGFSFEE